MSWRGGVVPSFHLRALVPSAALIGLLLMSTPQPARGQEMNWWNSNTSSYPRPALRTYRRSLSKSSRETVAAKHSRRSKAGVVAENQPTGPLFAILSLSDQHISVYN